MIYTEKRSKDGGYNCYIYRCMDNTIITNSDCCSVSNANVRHATEEEKQELFNRMKKAGLRWNAEEKRVEKIRWRASNMERYYFIGSVGTIVSDSEDYWSMDNDRYEFGNYFRTKEQVEEAAKRVKETLRKYHEEIRGIRYESKSKKYRGSL